MCFIRLFSMLILPAKLFWTNFGARQVFWGSFFARHTKSVATPALDIIITDFLAGPLLLSRTHSQNLDSFHFLFLCSRSSIVHSRARAIVPRSSLRFLQSWTWQITCKIWIASTIHTKLSWISRVTITFQKIFNICQYSSRDSMSNNRPH